ncbi:hypothetical protein MKQ70_30670 [Chitinophaga sedimenti]|uniref:hypothetical protein n=1 Tax=Chitinophaga sedimenti TaxID=2033606 RepID=UPI00200459A0|nr:hypothetical protein [Chitinophaga sedimenti]MCK7559103.1 hypothetical protein [Chitinophaga sedimenti]
MMMPQEQPVITRSAQDTLRWRVHIMNRGNSDEPLQLRYSAIPGGFRFVEAPPAFTLPPGGDTLIIVRALPDGQSQSIQNPQISVTASTPNNLVLATAYCQPLLVTNRYSDRTQDLMLQGNYFDASVRNLLTGAPYQEATLVSSYNDANTALDIKLQHLWFFQQHQRFFMDSYIYLKQGPVFAKAGNITALQEILLNGQGAQAGVDVGGGVSASYTYLYDNNNQVRYTNEKGYVQLPRITTHAIDIDRSSEGGLNFHTQLVHRRDPRAGVTSRLGSFSWKFEDKEAFQLRGVLGASDEVIDSTGERYTAAAGGLDISGSSGRYSWNSVNYVSGRRYAGFRRGLRLFDERFSMLLTDKIELGVRYLQQSNAPRLFNELIYNFVPQIDEQQIGEFSLRIMPSSNFSFTLRPYRHWQTAAYKPQNIPDFTSVSDRLALDVQLQTPSGFYATATYDIGSTQYNINREKANVFQSHKMNMSVGWNWISLSGWGQIRPFYLREYANMAAVYQAYRNFQVGPVLQRSLFKGQLQMMASAQFLYQDILPGWLEIYSARCAWQAGRHWLLHADYSLFAPGRYDFSNLGAGVSYLFSKPVGTPRASRYQLVFFDDRNNNGVREPGEAGIKGVLVRVGSAGMVSDAGGSIQFESGEREERLADITAPAGWMTEAQVLLPAHRGGRLLAIPAKRSAGITGKVQWEKGRYSQYSQSPNAWMVEASGHGKQFQAYVTEDGRFRLWLPPGTYDVALRQVQPSGSFEGVPSQIVILQGDEEATLQFRVKENEGGAIIKHFGKANK